MTTYPEAVDSINALFLAAWDLNAADIVGYLPEIRWYGTPETGKPDSSKFWCRHLIKNVISPQATLSNGVTAPGKKRFTSEGLVFVQLFCPKAESNALEKGRLLAGVAVNAYRSPGTSVDGCVWFRNVRINELEPEEPWYRLNVVAEYQFDEIA